MMRAHARTLKTKPLNLCPRCALLKSLDKLHQTIWGRMLTSTALFGLTMVVYQHLNRTLVPRIDLMTWVDEAIPFWPWTLVIYNTHGPIMLAAAVVIRARDFSRLLLAMLATNFLCYLGFILWTAHFPRPDVSALGPPWGDWMRSMYGMDPPGNTFPSIHVATTVLLVLRMRFQRGGWWWVAWGALICLSTMTVKQHFIADVLGGIALALGVYFLAYRDHEQRDERAQEPTP